MFDATRPCDSKNRQKNRYTRKELLDLQKKFKIQFPKQKMTMTEICQFYKTLDWKTLPKKKEDSKKIIGKNCISRSEKALRDYQERVVRYLGVHDRLLVYHKMGTGKTLTAVVTSQCFLDSHPTKKVIVITPASLTDNFKKTMLEYKNINHPEKYEFYSIQKATNLLKENKLDCKDNLVIIDEVHNYKANVFVKGGKLKSGRNIFEGYKCFLRAGKLLLLTGTPVYNRPEDLTVYKVLLNYNEKDVKGKTLLEIIKHYEEFDIDTLKCKVSFHDYSKNDSDFPKRVEIVKQIPMTAEYEKRYSKILDEIEELEQKKLVHTVFKKLSQGNRNQFENLTRRLTQNIDNSLALNAKLGYVIRYIRKMKKDNEKLPNAEKYKIVIYSQFKEHGIHLIMQKTTVPYAVVSGDTKVSERQKIVNAYNSGEINVLFITKAGGEGLDLKGTDAIFIMEPTWNENNSEQIIARAIRYKSHVLRPPNRQKVKVIHLIHSFSQDRKENVEKKLKEYLHTATTEVPKIPSFLLGCDYKIFSFQKAKQNVLQYWDQKLKDLSIEKNKC